MPRGRSINSFSLSELESQINSRKSQLGRLRKQRAKALKELNAIDRSIASVEGRARGGGGRAKNSMGLVKTMEMILAKSGKPMRVEDIMNGVLATGYKTTSANFRGIVNQTLIKEKAFVAPERGRYTLKK